MNGDLLWNVCEQYNRLLYYVRYRKCKLHEKIYGTGYWADPKMVAGRWLKSTPEANSIIADHIISGEPFWAGRFGDTELNMVYQVMANRRNEKNDGRAEALFRLCDNAGFFPEDMALGEKFADRMLADCSQIDLIGEWRRFMEDYIYYRYQPKTIMTELHCLEPWNMYMYPKSDIKPWTAALKGKKVLVIHPFTESIKTQYEENRTKIFSRIFDADDILPEFELKTLKAVQTLKNEKDARFETWFDALAWMEDECRKIDFDVAIIGCGAYGFPLAAEIKRMGKIAIHLGGVTQIMFGIIGRRWETEYKQFHDDVVNEYWIRPSEDEKIKGLDTIEDGCYW